MFSNRYRYLFILLLALYSFGNSLFSQVYTHYDIHAPAGYLFVVFLLISGLVWEGNRLIGNRLLRRFGDQEPIRRLIIFFIAGIFLSTILSLLVVFVFGFLLLHIPV